MVSSTIRGQPINGIDCFVTGLAFLLSADERHGSAFSDLTLPKSPPIPKMYGKESVSDIICRLGFYFAITSAAKLTQLRKEEEENTQ